MTWSGTYTDIVVGVIALIAFFVGIKKGFIKQIGSLIGGFAAFVVAVVLTALISSKLTTLTFFGSFVGETTKWFSTGFFESDIAVKIATMLAGGDLQGVPVNEFFGTLAAIAIADFVIWLVLYIALKFLIKGIKALLLKIVHLPVLSTVDRIFGAIWALIMTYCILIGIVLTLVEIAVSQFIPDLWADVQKIIAESNLLSIAHESNFIGDLIAKQLGMELPKLGDAAATLIP